MVSGIVPRQIRLYADARRRCPFDVWLTRLHDARARAAVRERVARMMLGNMGGSKSVGGGVFEMRVDLGPGYRINFGEHDRTIVVLLCGGDKGSQPSDIKRAKAYWGEYRRLTSHA